MFPPYDIPTGPKMTGLWRFMSALSFGLLIEANKKPDAAKAAWRWWLTFLRTGAISLLEQGLYQSLIDPSYPSPEQIADLVIDIQVWGAPRPSGPGVSELLKNIGL